MSADDQASPPLHDVPGHEVTIEPLTVPVSTDGQYPVSYRWRCTCSAVGAWKSRRWQAVQGAATHQRRCR